MKAVPETATTPDILVTGANGFVGSAVVRELVARGAGPRVRVLVRRPVPEWMTDSGVTVWCGDLTDAACLTGSCTGITTVVHLASQVGGDPALCTAVNERGTGSLLQQARRAGVPRVLYLSTCAVYRDGVHRGAAEPGHPDRRAPPGSVPVTDPSSATSRSRLAGERLVRAAGGIVLRPHLIYGEGDRHVVPTLARWLRAVPAWAAGGSARTSLVAVTDLAAVIGALALHPGTGRSGDVFHVAGPRPLAMRRLLTLVCELLDLPLPTVDLSLGEHRARTRAVLPAVSDHQYSLLTRDHWYESSRIWSVTGVSPGPGLARRFAEAADWYRETLGSGDRSPVLR
ncbi:NAD-dependent epimerase/dehydratase family protein [Amycolatopsis cynarae]|uniref:NAD-dependent epimerase/dehydratase family protein n=1 Tax=Amycolatopsis cynarae TaxID=2995223 RepID=A0ABY7B9Q5_9PSEU|nr:NAD-dependent epimerase/dehydratase family protein [Amycolatopsis sp. HUAS 11-8]WAL67972.1 NAD-dependent epimerase/dehydratase family protein [Amycolatopsis sp. HUAS 11-8]